MAKCKCDTREWRIRKKKLKQRSKHNVICLTCEFDWWTDNVEGIRWISEEETRKLKDPFSRFSELPNRAI